MKIILYSILLVVFSFHLAAEETAKKHQDMTVEIMQKIIEDMSEEFTAENNVFSFVVESTQLYCVWDVKADRMRLVSPIAKSKDVPAQFMEMALQANYHSVLDPRYAIGDGVLYAAFIHPLSPLTEEELRSAILQVAIAANTFGSTFTSGALVFPGQQQQLKPTPSAPVL